MLKNVFKNSSRIFGMRIFKGIIFLDASDHLSNYLHNLTLTSHQNCHYWYLLPLPNRSTRCHFQSHLHWSLLPVPSFDHLLLFCRVRFSVLAITVAASFSVYFSGKQSKNKCNSKSLIQ